MKTLDVMQRSDQWRQFRLGKISGSNAARVLTPAKRITYAQELLAEVLTGKADEIYVTDAMQNGIDTEDRARALYSLTQLEPLETPGLVIATDNERFICSPDAFVGKEGLLEIKCPGRKNHLNHWQKGPCADYIAQMQWQMYVCERQWCDFLSFNPDFPPQYEAYTQRILRDDDFIACLVEGAHKVLAHVDDFILSSKTA